MKRQIIALVGAGMIVGVTAAFAATPWFKSVTSQVVSGKSYKGDLFVYWSEQGLQPNAPILYDFDGTITATCGGVRTTIAGTLYTVTMPANDRGIIHQSVAIEAPCENPGNPVYSLSICDDTNNVCAVVR